MTRSGSSANLSTGLSSPVIFGAGLLLLISAPVIRGGNRHVALLMLEWLALLLLWLMALRTLLPASASALPAQHDDAPFLSAEPGAIAGVSRTIWVLALSPLWFGLLQLIPVPVAFWAALPGRELYLQGLAVVNASPAGFRPLTLTPDATWASVLAGIPLSAAFMLAFASSQRQLRVFVWALVLFALVQAVMGVLQLGRVGDLSFGASLGDRAIGTFANPNHFASYITMTIPLAILLLRQAIAQPRQRRRDGVRRLPTGAWWGLVLFLLLCGVLASGSRAGTITCLVVALLAVVLLPTQRNHSAGRRWGLLAAAALLVMVVVSVGVNLLFARFAAGPANYLDNDRGLMLVSTWDAAMAFWPFGSGLGSFAQVYPRFQPAGVKGFAPHAHSDFVQLLMEGGALTAVLGLLVGWLLVRQVRVLVRQLRDSPADKAALLQASCGLGFLAVFLHSWFDFNLRIPANAILAVFLLGVFLRPSCPRSSPSS